MATVDSRQQEEVAEIKQQFPGRCRVLAQVGEHAHSVTLQPQDRDATIKFLLKASYPDCAPQVAVRSGSLGEGETRQLEQELEKEAKSRLGTPMLAELLALAESWLSKIGLKPGATITHTPVYLDQNKKKKANKGRKRRPDEEDAESKLPPMKTADDVIKRIQWDDNLDKDDFVVGYVDRFRGLVEKYFSAFSWEDLASVDYNVLAVPRHRIQYFKYRGLVVWDKPSRLDLVFGSTGSKVTITDVMENYETFAQRHKGATPGQRNSSAASALQTSADGKSAVTSTSNDKGHDDDDDDDDDDGIQVTIGTVNSFSGATEEPLQVGEESGLDPHWANKLRPNHFLAFRVTNPDIQNAVQEIQDFILDHEPVYAECCIFPAALHVTLCTLGLDTPEQIANAAHVLHNLQADLRAHCPQISLRLHGVSNFFRRVVYAKVDPDPALLEFVDYVKLCLRNAGVDIRDAHEFVPHMTIMKVTRPVARKKGSSNVASWLYEGFADMAFGTQELNGIHLCRMGMDRREDGFYICPAEITFGA